MANETNEIQNANVAITKIISGEILTPEAIAARTPQEVVAIIRHLQSEVQGLQRAQGSMWNDRAALLRHNTKLQTSGLQQRYDAGEKPGTAPVVDSDYEEVNAEKRVVSAAFRVASLIQFHQQEGPDQEFEFHLALRNLIQVRTGKPLYLTQKDAGKMPVVTLLMPSRPMKLCLKVEN